MKIKIRYLIPLLLLYLYACTPEDPVDKFVDGATAICGNNITLGSHLNTDELSTQDLTVQEDHSNFKLSCKDIGTLIFGSDPYPQIFYIKEILFEVDENSMVNSLTGMWFELNDEGKSFVEWMRDQPDLDRARPELVESFEEMEKHTLQLNDMIRMRYEIERALGEPHSIRPVTWRSEKNRFSISSDDSNYYRYYTLRVSRR